MATKGYWKSGAVDSPPDTSTLTSKGYPTSGDPKTGTPATKPGAAWYYLQDQMRNTVIEAAGQTLAEPPSANSVPRGASDYEVARPITPSRAERLPTPRLPGQSWPRNRRRGESRGSIGVDGKTRGRRRNRG